MMHAEWLPVVMQGSFSEIYVIDCATLRFVEVNRAACANLQCDASQLAGKTWLDIANDLAPATLELVLQPLRTGLAQQTNLETTHARKDGSLYPIAFHLYYCASSSQPVFIAIGNDLSVHHEAALHLSEASRAEWSAQLEAVKEKERTRIAREIHDELGGNLTAIKMALARLMRGLSVEDKALIEKAAYVGSLVDRTIDASHRIACDERDAVPGILALGLVAAIDWQLKEFEKQAGIPCEYSSNKDGIDLHPERETALFRIFQEALTNIGKHARASRITVRLVCAKHSVQMEIMDNGQGGASSERLKPHSLGIRGMLERAHALGATLSVGAAPQGGTIVDITMPTDDGIVGVALGK